MSITGEFLIHTDGAARGNPGPAAYAVVVQRPGDDDVEEMGPLGKTTNNIAEYTALVKALELAHKLGGKRLTIQADSELMVQQMNGVYKVKNAGLLPLYEKARDLVENFERVNIRHIRREQNKRADALCNEVLDNPEFHAPLPTWSAPAQPAASKPAAAKPAPAPPAKKADFQAHGRAAALAYLSECAQIWAKGNAENPRPEEVVDQVWTIIKEAIDKK